MARIFGLVGCRLDEPGPILSALQRGHVVVAPTRTVTPRADVTVAAAAINLNGALVEHQDLVLAVDGLITRPRAGLRAIADLMRTRGFIAALDAIEGDFALAVFDRRDGRLWLARDRIGVRPLYFARAGSAFTFASRPRPLILVPGVGDAINRRFASMFAASHYRYIDNRPWESPYANVSQVPAAHWVCFDGHDVSSGRWWTMEEVPDFTESDAELATRYRELLFDAVGSRLAAVQKPAFSLSGGMDSSSVIAVAKSVTGCMQTAFSTVYTDRTYDESADIQPMRESIVADWRPIGVDDPDVIETVSRMVAAHDEPVATATWLSHYVLCSQVERAGFGALFGGLGGDELNAGEYEYFFFHFADLKAAGRNDTLDREIALWAKHHDHPIWKKNRNVAFEVMAQITDPVHRGRSRPDLNRMRRYYPALDRSFFNIETFEPQLDQPFASYLKSRTWQDISRETAPCCLRAEDRQCAAFGLENVVPFFDHRLIEFMFRVPGTSKIRDGVTKVLLREAMTGVLPDETRTRIKKTGWNAPAHLWFSGRGREPLFDILHSRRFREHGIYNVPEVIRIAEEHQAIVASGQPRENHMMFLWQLVNTHVWLSGTEAA